MDTKISKTVGLIARLRYFVPFRILKNVYQSLIVPYLTYGLVVWGNARKTYLNKILALQKRCIRLMYFVDRNEHAVPLFINANILSLNFLYCKSECNLMHDFLAERI